MGIGLWLAHDRETGELVGFCGYLVLPEVHATPELLYALREPFTGKGLATEMARVCIAEAIRRKAFPDGIVASVDAVNTASVRVLEKLGFERFATRPGAFGDMPFFRLTGDPLPPSAVDEIPDCRRARPRRRFSGVALQARADDAAELTLGRRSQRGIFQSAGPGVTTHTRSKARRAVKCLCPGGWS